MTARIRPVLTVQQYRERARALQVEVANIAWGLVVGPTPVGVPRRWRSLTPDETEEVFDRLMRAVSRFGTSDRARVASDQ